MEDNNTKNSSGENKFVSTNEIEHVEETRNRAIVKRQIISEEYGYIGLFVDTEGNRIGIHSRK